MFVITIIITGVSIFLAFRSLKQVQKLEEIHKVKKELNKSKIIFNKDAYSSPGSSSE
jgi:hypothetical protein